MCGSPGLYPLVGVHSTVSWSVRVASYTISSSNLHSAMTCVGPACGGRISGCHLVSSMDPRLGSDDDELSSSLLVFPPTHLP